MFLPPTGLHSNLCFWWVGVAGLARCLTYHLRRVTRYPLSWTSRTRSPSSPSSTAHGSTAALLACEVRDLALLVSRKAALALAVLAFAAASARRGLDELELLIVDAAHLHHRIGNA